MIPARDPLVVEEDAWRKFEPSLFRLHLSAFLCACAHFVNCDAVYSSPGEEGRGRPLKHSGKVDANRISDSSNVLEAKLEIA